MELGVSINATMGIRRLNIMLLKFLHILELELVQEIHYNLTYNSPKWL